jgi:hypothetical protein
MTKKNETDGPNAEVDSNALLDEWSNPSFPQYRKIVNGEMVFLEAGDRPSNCEIVKIDYTSEYRSLLKKILDDSAT